MHIESLALPDIKVIRLQKRGDDRGFFSETWNRAALKTAGVDIDFVQENQSLSRAVGTLRGLHFQAPPYAQDKLVRVVRGRIWDVAVDIRKGSATFGRWAAAEISAEAWNQILVPIGFAHGFCTLEPDTEVVYLVSNTYSADCDRAIRWDDPALAIAWPVEAQRLVLSEKDRAAPRLAEITSPF